MTASDNKPLLLIAASSKGCVPTPHSTCHTIKIKAVTHEDRQRLRQSLLRQHTRLIYKFLYVLYCTNNVLNGGYKYIQKQSFKFNFPALVIFNSILLP